MCGRLMRNTIVFTVEEYLMATTTTTAPGRSFRSDVGAERAFLLLRAVFTVAPIAFGLDKLADVLTNWERYLAPWINDLVPGTAHQAMLAVGVIEVVAGIAVAVAPRYGSLLVAAWLAGIIINLVTMGDFFDVALRDFGLLVGALALASRPGTAAGPPRERPQ